MSDLIDRQEAIEAIMSEPPDAHYPSWYADILWKLPTACNETKRQATVSSDCINRQDAIDAINAYLGLSAVSRTIQNMTSIQEILENLPSAKPEINKQELIRTMNAGIITTNTKDVYSCGMRNGIRWCRALLEDDPPKFEDASQYAEPEIIHCKNCKHRDSNDCPMYYEEWIEIDEGDGYFDTDNIIHDWTTDEGFCHCAELRGKEE